MAEFQITVVLFSLLFLAVASEGVGNKEDETLLRLESKHRDYKAKGSVHSAAIKKDSNHKENIRKIPQDEDFAQESVEDAQTQRSNPENNYDFGYAVNDAFDGHQFRQERMDDDGTVHGRFGYRDKKGMFRQVDYTADDYGFRANIKSNEPGIRNLQPANVKIDRTYISGRNAQHPQYSREQRKPAEKVIFPSNTEERSYNSDANRQEIAYKHNSEEEQEAEQVQSSYTKPETFRKESVYQVPTKNGGKAIVYQYFHKQHVTHHEQAVEHPSRSNYEESTAEAPYQHPHHRYPQPQQKETNQEEEYRTSNAPLPTTSQEESYEDQEPRQQKVIFPHQEAQVIRKHPAHQRSPKYIHNTATNGHHHNSQRPKYSTLVTEYPHQRHEYEIQPEQNPHPVVKDDYIKPIEHHRKPNTPVIYEQPRYNTNEDIYYRAGPPSSHHENQEEQNNYEAYVQTAHPHAVVHGNEEYLANVPYPRHVENERYEQSQNIVPSNMASHSGFMRDSSHRHHSRPISQETSHEVETQLEQEPSYKNAIKSKGQHDKYRSFSNHPSEPKFPVKILYTPSENPKTSINHYHAPVHKKNFRQEIVYGFPVHKHLQDGATGHKVTFHDRHLYGIDNSTSNVKDPRIESINHRYSNDDEIRQEVLPKIPRKQKAYLLLKQAEYQPNDEYQTASFKQSDPHETGSTTRQKNQDVGPKFAVLFDPAVFRHFDKFRISAKANVDESKWIPIIPQIKWIPRSTPPPSDWIPMSASSTRKYTSRHA